MNLYELHEKLTRNLFPAYSSQDERFLALALCGEAGELANLIKKRWRDRTLAMKLWLAFWTDYIAWWHRDPYDVDGNNMWARRVTRRYRRLRDPRTSRTPTKKFNPPKRRRTEKQ